MFGKKKQKQETLVRMRNLAQLDEGFFAHMKDGKDMFDATDIDDFSSAQRPGLSHIRRPDPGSMVMASLNTSCL